jgi:hypothetical protein
MAKLRIGFSISTKKWKPLASLIVWWDRVRFGSTLGASHCYGRFVSASWERDFIYQAAGYATHFMGGSRFAKLNTPIEEYELEVPDEVVTKIGRICVDREGKPYAVKQLVGIILIGLAWLLTFGTWDPKNPFADGDAQTVCLEEWGRILAEALGVEIMPDLDAASISSFRDWVAKLPQVKLVYSKGGEGG